jgi:hypothetical protein
VAPPRASSHLFRLKTVSLAGEFAWRHTFLRRASLDTIWAAALAIRGAFSKQNVRV